MSAPAETAATAPPTALRAAALAWKYVVYAILIAVVIALIGAGLGS